MHAQQIQDSISLIRQALDDLEKPKESVAGSVQKILRAARSINDEGIIVWCEVQLGNTKYTYPLKKLIKIANAVLAEPDSELANNSNIDEVKEAIKEVGFKMPSDLVLDEINFKSDESGGGCSGIGFIEERYADLVRSKKGNNGTYYKTNLHEHINYVRQTAHQFAITLYNQLAYSDTPQTAIDMMRGEVDSHLLDLAPELAEKLMIAFKSVVSNKSEEWSQALTTCRRFLEQFADVVYPASEPNGVGSNGRALGKEQYINRGSFLVKH